MKLQFTRYERREWILELKYVLYARQFAEDIQDMLETKYGVISFVSSRRHDYIVTIQFDNDEDEAFFMLQTSDGIEI